MKKSFSERPYNLSHYSGDRQHLLRHKSWEKTEKQLASTQFEVFLWHSFPQSPSQIDIRKLEVEKLQALFAARGLADAAVFFP